jgi:tetratricopeptide (TPR) repeat protein
VPLLEEGLAAVGEDAVELRIRLLSRLAGALRDEPSRARRAELSNEAVELARRSGTSALLEYALSGRGHAIAAPDTLDECVALGGELRDIARQNGNLERVVAAHSLRVVALLMQSELAAAERELEASTTIAQEIRHAVPLWDVTSTAALLALANGDFAAAEERIEEAFAIGRRALPDAATAIHTMQHAALADLRGGLAEFEPAIRELASTTPERPVFRCSLVYVQARLGRLDETRQALDELGPRYDSVPFDQEWLFAMSFLAEAAAITSHPSAAVLYDALAPWEQLSAADVGEGFRGSIARYLGLLAASNQRPDDARRHFEYAQAVNAQVGARPWVAHTQRDLGLLLMQGPEATPGHALIEQALATYTELGMAPHVDHVRTLLPSR